MSLIHLIQGLIWRELLFGREEWTFLIETAGRTFIMFLVIIIGLRILGKRGVKQLSIFELVVIIGLGSAAGDPMIYKEVGILPSIMVFIVVIGFYKLITYIIGISKSFEQVMEGKSVYLIRDGEYLFNNFKKEDLGEDEFFSELRLQGVSQLGQIQEAIRESSGNISIFYYPDAEVKFGLPLMPEAWNTILERIEKSDFYSCAYCGHTEKLEPVSHKTCPDCEETKWLKSSDKKRIP